MDPPCLDISSNMGKNGSGDVPRTPSRNRLIPVTLQEIILENHEGNDETRVEACDHAAAFTHERMKAVEAADIDQTTIYKPGDDLDVTHMKTPGLKDLRVSHQFRGMVETERTGQGSLISDPVVRHCGPRGRFLQRQHFVRTKIAHIRCPQRLLFERLLMKFNSKRYANERITYEIRSSTIETEWVKAQLAMNADTDCVIYTRLNYMARSPSLMATRAKR